MLEHILFALLATFCAFQVWIIHRLRYENTRVWALLQSEITRKSQRHGFPRTKDIQHVGR